MTEVRRMLERSVDGYAPDLDAGLEATLRRAARRDRRRRAGIAFAVLAPFGAVAVVSFALALRQPTSPASSPTLPPSVRPATPVVVPGAAPVSGRISLCVASGPDASECGRAATTRVGDVVELRGERRLSSLPGGTRAEVWWRTPNRDGWRRADAIAADEGGRITWTWRPTESDAGLRYSFQLRVPLRRASPVVEVRVQEAGG